VEQKLLIAKASLKKKVKVVGFHPTPNQFFEKNWTKNFSSQKHEMLLYQSF